jgi:myo-inositol 2-dehydrogenase / D-chiro-inositol 1-dehydrogenase
VVSPSGPVRVGVLGTGRIGRLHAELLAEQVPGAALVAVYDVVEELARPIAERFDARVAASAGELLAAGDVDAVAICTTTDTHVDAIVAAAAAGKAILCEKPISLDLADVDRALAAVDESGVLFQVGFNRRFDPAHQSVHDAVASGAIGDVHLVRISSRDPAPPPVEYARHSGGIFLDMTIHDFDMARYVTGSEVVEVFARGAVRIVPELSELGDVDTAAVVLVHESGAIAAIDNSRQAVYGFDQRVEAFGSGGMAASENPFAHTGVVRTKDGTRAATLPYFFLERYVPSYVREWEAFVRAFREGLPSPVGGPDGRAPLAIGLAALRSQRENRPVRVDEVG